MAILLDSFRYALRLALRKPGFSALVVLILAIGIGANTAMFSLINGVLLQPMRFAQPDRLFRLFHADLQGAYSRGSVTPGNFADWKSSSSSFESMAGYYITAGNLTGRGDPIRLLGAGMAGDLFQVLGAAPLMGRTFSPQEQLPGAPAAVVISYSAWQRLFGGRADVLGEDFVLNGEPQPIIGVMPKDFRFPSPSVDFWSTARWSDEFRFNRFEYFLRVLARLNQGVSVSDAEAEMEGLMSELRRRFPMENENTTVNIVPLQEEVVGGVRQRLAVLMGAVGFVLIIACVNLANLFLAKANARRHEIAVRQALGAARPRVMILALSETVLLGLLGAAAGLLLGWGLLNLISRFVLSDLPRVEEVGFDLTVFAFTAAAGILSGLVFGLLPALRSLGVSPANALRERSRSGGSRRMRRLLVVSEVALALVLLAGAGLLIRSLAALHKVDPGFSTERLLTFRVSLPGEKYDVPARAAFFREASQRLTALPDVRSASAVNSLPVTGRGSGAWFNIVGRPVEAGSTPPAVMYRIVTPEYLPSMGIPLIRGRQLSDSDGRDGSPSVLVNEALAQRFFPNEDPIGHQIVLGPLQEEAIHPPARIVGIVRNVRNQGLDSEFAPLVYLPHALTPQWTSLAFTLRTRGQPLDVLPSVRNALNELDSGLPLFAVDTLQGAITETLAPTRSSMVLLGSFAIVSLVMAALGVFGTLSYSVSQRRRELGVRMALGADRPRIFGLILREGMGLTLAGIGLGLIGSLSLTRLMSGMLFEVSPMDPLTLTGVAAMLVLVAFSACTLPARRAAKLDPIRSLRRE